ncbi:MAG: FapA family protein [bacterium]
MNEAENTSKEKANISEEPKKAPKEAVKTPNEAKKGEGISLMVSASKMHASVELAFQTAKDWSPDRLRSYVMSEGIVYGIDEQAIKNLFEKNVFNKSVVVAKGTPSKNGEDGTVRHHVNLECLAGRPKVLQTGGVNHRELGLFEAVDAGKLLAERIPPTEGVPGRDVYGNEIAATDGKEAKLSGGKNTSLSEDGNQLTASIEGCLTGTRDKLEVIPSLSISGDVNYKTGNISSNVAVVISGGILPDFVVQANEDVNITGLVDSARIMAGGRIAINAGIQGGGKAQLIAEKEIIARFVNEATLKAKGDIIIQGPVTHCNIETEGQLIVEGKNATILGGKIYANQGVTADTIGSEMGIKTYVRAGPQLQETNEKITAMELQRKSLVPNIAKLEQLLHALAQAKEKLGSLPPDKQAIAAKVQKTFKDLKIQLQGIDEELQKLAAERERQMSVQRTINVKGYTYPGTQIRILNSTFVPMNPMKSCTFAIMDGEIQAFPFRDSSEEKEKKKK